MKCSETKEKGIHYEIHNERSELESTLVHEESISGGWRNKRWIPAVGRRPWPALEGGCGSAPLRRSRRDPGKRFLGAVQRTRRNPRRRGARREWKCYLHS